MHFRDVPTACCCAAISGGCGAQQLQPLLSGAFTLHITFGHCMTVGHAWIPPHGLLLVIMMISVGSPTPSLEPLALASVCCLFIVLICFLYCIHNASCLKHVHGSRVLSRLAVECMNAQHKALWQPALNTFGKTCIKNVSIKNPIPYHSTLLPCDIAMLHQKWVVNPAL